jgi:hypothetical protein
MMEIDNIRKERDTALAKVNELTSKFMGYSNPKHKKSKKFKYYTGITCETFDNVFKYLATSFPKTCHSKISFEDQFLMTLIKLRGCLPKNRPTSFNAKNDFLLYFVHELCLP